MTFTYSSLRRHIAAGELLPVYVILGAEDLLRDLAAGEIEAAVLEGVNADFNFDRFDGESASAHEVIAACNLFPLLGGRRLVVVKRAKELLEAGSDAFAAYLEDPCPHSVLVLVLEGSPDTRRKGWKGIEKKAAIVRCDPLKERELEGWIAEQARNRGVSLDREQVRFLASEIGSDLRRVSSELEKLHLYAGGGTVESREIGSLLGKGRAQSVFKLTDAVADGNVASALRQIGRLLDEGEPPLRILAFLDGTIGDLLAVKALRSSTRGVEDLGSILRAPAWKVEKLARQVQRFEERDLLQALAALASCDRAMKSSGAPPRLLLESLVIRLCGGGAEARGRGGRTVSARGSRGNSSG